MYCPQCGQQQLSENLRFCSRCGFPLEGVIHLLGSGGTLAFYQAPTEAGEMSPKRRGVRQGAILFLVGAVLLPVLGVIYNFTQGDNLLDILVPLAAILFFLGGLMRMLFAAIFEQGARPQPRTVMPPSFVPPIPAHFSAPAHGSLPPAPANPAAGWRPRPEIPEIRQPSSVTENTTRLLDKDEPINR